MSKIHKKWLSVSLPEKQENRLRQRYLKEDISQAITGIIILLIPLVAFVINDYQLFHNSPMFFSLAALRAFLVITSVCFIIYLKHIKRHQTFDMLLFIWALFGIVAVMTINLTRIQYSTMYGLIDSTFILVFYLLIPNKLDNQIILASLFTIGEAVIFFLVREPLPQPILFTIIFTFLLANAAGLAGSWRMKLLRRREFTAREKDELSKRKLEQMATMDGLTGIYNSRAILQIARSELTRFHRYGRSFTFLMMDIDHFKMINDNYGHLVGDNVLKNMVEVITAQLRHIDIMGRLGGEEFGIILPETDEGEAMLISERILQVVRAMRVQAEGKEPVRITISIGRTSVHTGDTGPDSFIARADAAMYRAKRNGRDRVEIDDKATG